MKISDNVKAMLWRLARVLIAQAVSWSILEFAGINIPLVNISVGATISAVAKYLRDKFKWDWLPV